MDKDRIRDAIRAAYDGVGRDGSRGPAGLDLATGRGLAVELGYAEGELAGLPADVMEAFVGAGALAPRVVGRTGERVLDLGCGAGLDSLLLARRGYSVVSLDPSGPMLARLARHRDGARGNPSPVRATLPAVPLASGVAQWALLNGVANLIPDRDRLLAEVHRLLAPGGVLLVADLIAVDPIPAELLELPEAWAWCLAGAASAADWDRRLSRGGFTDTAVDVLESMPPVARAVIRARRGVDTP